MSSRRYNLRERKSRLDPRRASFIEEKLAESSSSSDDIDYETSALARGFRRNSDLQEEVDTGDIQKVSDEGDDEEDSSSSSSSSSSQRREQLRRRKRPLSSSEEELDEDGNLKDLIDDGINEIYEEILKKKGDEDWVLDTSLLGVIIEKNLIKEFPELEEERNRVHKAIIEALNDADEGLVQQYCGVKPVDKIWKVHATPEEVETLELRLKAARDNISAEEPTLFRILQADLTEKDRQELIQLFDIYKNTEPYTVEQFELRKRINSTLEKSHGNVSKRMEADEEADRIMKTAESLTTESMKMRIVELQADDLKKKRMLEILEELKETPPDTTMYRSTKEKLEWLVLLPYNKIQPLEIDFAIATAKQINDYCYKIRDMLDNDPDIGLYGMSEAKNEIITALNNRITNPRSNVMVCLTGPPGAGKSALSAAVAKAIGLPFERISLGGVTDPCFLLGSDTHYAGSAPGIILKSLKNMKVSNGVILLDEVDKLGLGSGEKSLAVQTAAMHVTDYTTNHDFRDTFLTDFGHDISNVWFMATCNEPEHILAPLRDRLYIIPVEKYTYKELKLIARNYVLPRTLKNIGIPKDLVSMDDSGAAAILNMLGNHINLEGARPIQKIVKMIVSRINLLRTTTLPDGTMGKLQTTYQIPNFKLPIVINSDVVHQLVDRTKLFGAVSESHMYI